MDSRSRSVDISVLKSEKGCGAGSSGLEMVTEDELGMESVSSVTSVAASGGVMPSAHARGSWEVIEPGNGACQPDQVGSTTRGLPGRGW